MTQTARKALATFVVGLNTWSAIYLPPPVAGFAGVCSAAFMAWLVPNSSQPN